MMQIIEFLQQFSNPILDWFFRIVTEFGDMIFFILVGAIIYWAIDKKFAFKLMVSYIFSAMVNGAIKSFTKKNRPYQDGAKAILQETTGSSMPSGHSQAIGALGGVMLYKKFEIKWLRYTSIILMILVPLSRMYLGQHYLEDVLVGLGLGLILGPLTFFLLSIGSDDKEDIRAFYLIPFLILAMIFVYNDQLYTAAGGYLGLVIGYFIEKRYVKYDVKSPLKIQVLKVLMGLIIALIFKEGLKYVFALMTDHYIMDFIRYFIVGIWASLGAMFTFKKIFVRES